MQTEVDRSASPPRSFVRIAPVRALIAALFVVLALMATQVAVVGPLRDAFDAGGASPTNIRDAPPAELLFAAASALAALAAYYAYVRLVERRAASELSGAGAARELFLGALLGAGLVTAVVGTLWLLGYYGAEIALDWTAVAVSLGFSVFPAVAEEVLFRGILFRVSEESLGTWFALLFSALLFGVLHSSNPGATVASSVVVALTGGVLLGVAYVLTRRLWFAIGLHVAWNFTQTGVFGMVTDGADAVGLLDGRVTGPELISGGSYGPQAGAVALVACLVASVSLLLMAVRRGRPVPTPWGGRTALRGGLALFAFGSFLSVLVGGSLRYLLVSAAVGAVFAAASLLLRRRPTATPAHPSA